MRLGLMVLLLALAPVAFAQDDKKLVGKDAPDFEAADCINAPEATTLEQCKGDVILIKLWGIN
jgi:hypothetical protein